MVTCTSQRLRAAGARREEGLRPSPCPVGSVPTRKQPSTLNRVDGTPHCSGGMSWRCAASISSTQLEAAGSSVADPEGACFPIPLGLTQEPREPLPATREVASSQPPGRDHAIQGEESWATGMLMEHPQGAWRGAALAVPSLFVDPLGRLPWGDGTEVGLTNPFPAREHRGDSLVPCSVFTKLQLPVGRGSSPQLDLALPC